MKMKNSLRVAWYEAAYSKIRESIVPEAPPDATICVGFPSKKKSGKNLTVGECAFDCVEDHGGGFGAENILTLHLLQGDDLVASLATLVHEMIHLALDPTVKHGREFQQMARRVGLVKPWTATTADEVLAGKLRGIVVDLEGEMGYRPRGKYVIPPPPPPRPSTTRRMKCECVPPRRLSLGKKIREEGTVLCGVCERPFFPEPLPTESGDSAGDDD